MCCHLCECLCVCVCGRERASEHIYSRIDHALAAPPSLLAQHGVHTHDTRNTHHTQAYTHTCTHTHHDKKAEARRRVCTIAMPHHVAVSMCVRVSIRAYVCAHGDENQGIHTKPFEVYTPSLLPFTTIQLLQPRCPSFLSFARSLGFSSDCSFVCSCCCSCICCRCCSLSFLLVRSFLLSRIYGGGGLVTSQQHGSQDTGQLAQLQSAR